MAKRTTLASLGLLGLLGLASCAESIAAAEYEGSPYDVAVDFDAQAAGWLDDRTIALSLLVSTCAPTLVDVQAADSAIVATFERPAWPACNGGVVMRTWEFEAPDGASMVTTTTIKVEGLGEMEEVPLDEQ